MANLAAVTFGMCYYHKLFSKVIITGAKLCYPDEGFNPLKSLQAISDEKLTSVYGVPTMFIDMLRVNEENKGKFDLSSIRTGIIAGSVAPRPVKCCF